MPNEKRIKRGAIQSTAYHYTAREIEQIRQAAADLNNWRVVHPAPQARQSRAGLRAAFSGLMKATKPEASHA